MVFVFIVLSVILTLAQSVILQPIIDDYIVPLLKNPDNIEYKIGCIRMIFILIGIAVLTGVCNYVQARIMIAVSQKTVKRLR